VVAALAATLLGQTVALAVEVMAAIRQLEVMELLIKVATEDREFTAIHLSKLLPVVVVVVLLLMEQVLQ